MWSIGCHRGLKMLNHYVKWRSLQSLCLLRMITTSLHTKNRLSSLFLFYYFFHIYFFEWYSGELSIGVFHQKKEFVKNLQAVCHGDRHHNCRAILLDATDNPASHVLTVEEQVDCLVDMATDANILGRIYIGWCPWIWLITYLFSC